MQKLAIRNRCADVLAAALRALAFFTWLRRQRPAPDRQAQMTPGIIDRISVPATAYTLMNGNAFAEMTE